MGRKEESIRDGIVNLLKDATSPLSGEEMSGRLGISRSAVWKHIKKLRSEGYVIDSRSGCGYFLKERPDSLLPREIRKGLKTRLFGQYDIVCEPVLTSTNEKARGLLLDGVPEGTLVLAESQTSGRGRRGRNWFSPPGVGLYVSLIALPDISVSQATCLSLGTAVAVARAVEDVCGLKVDIKWPNDLLLKGKKLGGILVEINGDIERVNSIVIGIGLNVNNRKELFPPSLQHNATSLFMATGKSVDRISLLQALLERFEEVYHTFLYADYNTVLDEWRLRTLTLGRKVVISTIDGRLQSGYAIDILEDGSLLLETDEGERKTIVFGEIL
nr:biotin--[acetyl-CoA-carboxylase] ligase [Desulfobacterales bacterium]